MPMTRDSGWHIGTMPWNRAQWDRTLVVRSKAGKLVKMYANVKVRIKMFQRRPQKPWEWVVWTAGGGRAVRGLTVTDEQGKVAADAAIRAMRKAV